MLENDVLAADSDEERFAETMKFLREERGWSQGELARKMTEAGWEGIHQTTISRIEKGERPIRLGEALAIAAILEKDLPAFFAPSETVRLEEELKKATWHLNEAWMNASAALLDLERRRDELQRLVTRALAPASFFNETPNGAGFEPVIEHASEILAKKTMQSAYESAKRDYMGDEAFDDAYSADLDEAHNANDARNGA